MVRSGIKATVWFSFMLFLLWSSYASKAEACQLCIPFPKTTLADRLLQSKKVILAREKMDKPYSFHIVEVLKGTIQEEDFEAFINTTARRMLMHNPGDVVVFRMQHNEAGWLYTAYADMEFQDFVRAILVNASDWNEFSGNRKRIDFFAERLNHSDRQIWEQAYLEVGRAPYASIKRIASTVPRQQIRGFLDNWRLIEWHSLYILMLGQSRHPDDMAYVRNKVEAAAVYGSKINLSAWVSAFIEMNPDTGVEEIEYLYFSDQRRTPDELQEVCKALSTLGSEGGMHVSGGRIERRKRIVRSYASLLENHPQMAGLVARDLTIWQVRALVEELEIIRGTEPALDPNTKMAINHYLSMAQRFDTIETTR